jgi:hypothetical protein
LLKECCGPGPSVDALERVYESVIARRAKGRT